MDGKKYDILLLGSTGYTGQMVLEYFLKNYQGGISSGEVKLLCGVRSTKKFSDILLRMKEKEGVTCSEKINTKECDVGNYDSILSCCSMCRVVISTVGPYATYGYNIVKACVEGNCHYVDVCGEHTFMLKIYKEFNEIAKKKKLKIIHGASFISAISDLGTFIIQEEFLKRYKQPCPYIRVRLSAEGSEFRTVGKSTIKSILQFRKDVQNDYNEHYLCENKYEKVVNDEVSSYLLEKENKKKSFFDYEKEFGYCFGTVYSAAEETYVLYGKNLIVSYQQYDAHLTTPMYILRKMLSTVKNMFNSVVAFALRPFGLGNYLASKYVDWLHTPKTAAELRKAFWTCAVVGQSYVGVSNSSEDAKRGKGPAEGAHSKSGNQERKIFLHLSGKNEDPGYLLSAKIISESALSLLESTLPDTFGVLSVSVGLGQVVVERLRKASLGMRIEV
ncbi:hypothetical protein PCYB_041150 [Plasmodium cynomolgi strain B]|uniref:Saccharopine dehydrogenase NADP binding domain-containing protein n=1 Tax=Plasmodium cynomolgi (strain B) TaxID=1120755 RepID=K6UID5_PLACD|nr:hypothetical protein PCYB_041150 [Plasmodium cynomolgi strain B]GAB64913.1 hypothetical protein PCYB_041150 [Plasmodium cynomolgi strain B]